MRNEIITKDRANQKAKRKKSRSVPKLVQKRHRSGDREISWFLAHI